MVDVWVTGSRPGHSQVSLPIVRRQAKITRSQVQLPAKTEGLLPGSHEDTASMRLGNGPSSMHCTMSKAEQTSGSGEAPPGEIGMRQEYPGFPGYPAAVKQFWGRDPRMVRQEVAEDVAKCTHSRALSYGVFSLPTPPSGGTSTIGLGSFRRRLRRQRMGLGSRALGDPAALCIQKVCTYKYIDRDVYRHPL